MNIVSQIHHVAVPVSDNNNWSPISEKALDLRLAMFTDEERVNDLVCKHAEKMGDRLEGLYTQASKVSTVGVEALLKYCPNLKALNLCCAYQTDDALLQLVAGFSKLEELNLHFAKNEPVIEYLGDTCRVPEWARKLVTHVTDIGVAEILARCHQLKSLDLSGTDITTKTFEAIAAHKGLSFVRLYSCWKLKAEEIKAFAEKMPHLTIQTDDGHDATEAYQELARKAKSRYYKGIPQVDRSIKLTFQDSVPEEEKEFIDLSLFVNLR